MEGQEHVYCDVISDAAIPPSIKTSRSQQYLHRTFSGTQVILMIAVAIFATLSIVFMTLYFTNEAKHRPCQNCSHRLVSNDRMKDIKTTISKCIETVPRNCSDLYKHGMRKDGVYTIDPDGLGAFNVSCDMTTSGGGWTVFQRRIDGSVDFYRGWSSYKEGFGNLNGEFWLGLDKIHRLSKSGENILRVDLEDFENETRYAEFLTFAVANKAEKYKLTVGGGYLGNAGDSLTFHDGMKFSTKDADNDKSPSNCAVTHKGAWWYNACHSSHLNGQYLRGAHTSDADGINWRSWKGLNYSLKKTEMKIRPRSF